MVGAGGSSAAHRQEAMERERRHGGRLFRCALYWRYADHRRWRLVLELPQLAAAVLRRLAARYGPEIVSRWATIRGSRNPSPEPKAQRLQTDVLSWDWERLRGESEMLRNRELVRAGAGLCAIIHRPLSACKGAAFGILLGRSGILDPLFQTIGEWLGWRREDRGPDPAAGASPVLPAATSDRPPPVQIQVPVIPGTHASVRDTPHR
jgi:hypothetical protein